MANLFISYSHGDEDIRLKIVEHLSNLSRQKILSIWDDRFLLAGEEFTPQIMQQMLKSDIIILLISSKFLRSDYCMDKELPIALRMHHDGEAVTIPVIVNDCAWEDIGADKLVALPKDKKPIKKHGNRDEAYAYIANKIKERVILINSRSESIRKYLNRGEKTFSLTTGFLSWSFGVVISLLIGTIKKVIALIQTSIVAKPKRSKKKEAPTLLPLIIILALVTFALSSPPFYN